MTSVPDGLLTESTQDGRTTYSGPVHVEGRYHAGLLAVTRGTATDRPTGHPSYTTAVPCPAPAGGWQPGPGGPAPRSEADKTALRDAVLAAPERFAEPWTAFPSGIPSTLGLLATMPRVLVVGVTGSVDQARTELAAIFQGNLCVYHVARSKKELDAIINVLSSINS